MPKDEQAEPDWGSNPKPTMKPGPGIYVTGNQGKDQTKVVGTDDAPPDQHG